jgi:hypothetical protein
MAWGMEGKEGTILCPFAVYYLRYAVRSFFTMSRISLVDGKRAGQKVQCKIASFLNSGTLIVIMEYKDGCSRTLSEHLICERYFKGTL